MQSMYSAFTLSSFLIFQWSFKLNHIFSMFVSLCLFGKAVEYCVGVHECGLQCDFGYKRDANGCEMCACQCVTEENYFDEIKNAFRVSLLNESSRFCRKPCKLGYIKDQFNCFRCECVEDAREKSMIVSPSPASLSSPPQFFPSTVLTTTKLNTDDDYCAVPI